MVENPTERKGNMRQTDWLKSEEEYEHAYYGSVTRKIIDELRELNDELHDEIRELRDELQKLKKEVLMIGEIQEISEEARAAEYKAKVPPFKIEVSDNEIRNAKATKRSKV